MIKKRHGVILVALFLLTFIWWGSARADALVEIGPAQVGATVSTGVMLTLSERINDRYDFTVGYISDQEFHSCPREDCVWMIRPQLFFGAELLMSSPWTDKLKLGLGPYYFQNVDRVATTHFRMGLSLEYRFTERFGIRARHFSNAGSGQDVEICNDHYCIENNWNAGQDSWLRLVWYF